MDGQKDKLFIKRNIQVFPVPNRSIWDSHRMAVKFGYF